MASTLTRFGQYCRELRENHDVSMGDQANAFACPVHVISSIETGKVAPSEPYVEQFRTWLGLTDAQYSDLIKRTRSNVIELRRRRSYGNNTTSMRLFRKVSQMPPAKIRGLRKKIDVEVKDDR
jgi:hypothetical protein